MRSLRMGAVALFSIGMFALSAGPAPAVSGEPSWGRHGGQHIAGQYSGTVTDSALGYGSATANIATTQVSAGGWFNFTFGSATYANALAGETGFRGVEGVFVATIGSVACNFAFRGRYDASGNTLTGQYKAVNGCSGESGSFSLTEQCYYDQSRDVRHDNGLMRC
ncbi:MAG TPA: hypothetical protein VGX91_10020 [Candidatus Cybelea sp.]|nr:hypothetical protein [Candidatus Cybelea sp.]